MEIRKSDVLNMKKVHSMELKAENVSFKYPSAKKYLLKDHTEKIYEKKLS